MDSFFPHFFAGPCYEVEREHHFTDLLGHVEDLQTLHGPVFAIDNKHCYEDRPHKNDLAKQLMGPVLQINREHHFQAIEQHMEDLKTLKGPIYGRDHKEYAHHFNEIEKHIESLKSFQGPVYKNIEREHKYNEPQRIKPDLDELLGPVYHIERDHFYIENDPFGTKPDPDLKDLKVDTKRNTNLLCIFLNINNNINIIHLFARVLYIK